MKNMICIALAATLSVLAGCTDAPTMPSAPNSDGGPVITLTHSDCIGDDLRIWVSINLDSKWIGPFDNFRSTQLRIPRSTRPTHVSVWVSQWHRTIGEWDRIFTDGDTLVVTCR